MSEADTSSVGSFRWRSLGGSTDGTIRSAPVKDTFNSDLEFRVRRQELALAQADTRVKELETHLTLCQSRERQQREETTADVLNLKSQLQSAQKQYRECSCELERVRDRLKSSEMEVVSARTQKDTIRQQVSAEMWQKHRHLTDRNDQLIQDLTECRRRLKQTELQLLQQQQQNELDRFQLPRSPIEGATDNDSESVQQQLTIANKRIIELEAKLQSAADDVELVKILRDKVTSHQHLVDKNAQMNEELISLRGVVDRTLLLKEQLATAEHKLQSAESYHQQLQQLQAQSDEEGKQLLLWKQIAVECDVECTPAAVRDVISELRSQHLILTAKLAEIRADANENVSASSSACKQREQAENQLKNTKQQLSVAMTQQKKLQRKLNLITMERDSLKSILSSYESETSLTLTSIEKQKQDGLEACLAESRRQTEQLEIQLLKLSQTADSVTADQDSAALCRLSQQLETARSQLEAVQQENIQLRDEMEERALRGDYNPAKTRVLTLRENPASSASSALSGQLQRLRQENSTLHARLKQLNQQLDQLKQQQPGSASGETAAVDAKRIAELQSRARSAEQRASRLKEVFHHSVQQLRHSISSLTGFKISSDGEHIKLRSVYSPHTEHFLHFQRDSEDSIHLLETEMSACYHQLLETWLWRRDSIPGFLAALQLHLFEQLDSTSSQEQQQEEYGDDQEVVELD